MNEKIKEIAIFDVLTNAHNGVHRDPAPYLTDLNALHRVALDVMEKVSSENMIHRLHNAMLFRPINGQYTDLVDAVYDAIVYMKNHNQCQPK